MKNKEEFDCLVVSHVDIFTFKENAVGKIKAFATIVINDQLIIRGLRVTDGLNGLYVGYPADPFYKGDDFKCVCGALTKQLRDHIESTVLEAYQEKVKG